LPRSESSKLRNRLGQNVSFFRKSLGLSQNDLAKTLNVTKQTVWRVEAGSTNVSMEMLESLSQALQVDAVHLIWDKAAPGRENGLERKRLDEVSKCLNQALKVVDAYRQMLDQELPPLEES
jgi:putative transcriptional regulator